MQQLVVAVLFLVEIVVLAHKNDLSEERRILTFERTVYPELTREVLNIRYGTDSLDSKVDESEESDNRLKRAAKKKKKIKVPVSFDMKTANKWRKCQTTFKKVQDAGNCGSGWAIVVAQMITDRRCIVYKKPKPAISAWDIVSCCVNCRGHSPTSGCEGGTVSKAMKFYQKKGVVTGGFFGGTILSNDTTNQHTYGRIVGWGVENSTKFWKVGHVWGETWGEQGFFRIIRGVDNCEVESRAMAVTVKKD
ncbi:Papain family cysteine protease [Aphelenchoides bicaudatus]|nr:Papain family cysteine protease [Aphelenchoides bicaudatus]